LNDLTEAVELATILSPFNFGALGRKPKEEIKPEWFI
jgi:hypothetical protein